MSVFVIFTNKLSTYKNRNEANVHNRFKTYTRFGDTEIQKIFQKNDQKIFHNRNKNKL